MIKRSKKYTGVLFLFISQLLFVVNFNFVNFLNDFFSVPQLIFCRSIIAPIVILPILLSKKITVNFRRPGMLLVRSVAGLGAMTCLYFAFKYGEMGQSMLLFHCSFAWVFIISCLFLNEKPHLWTFSSIPLLIIGLILTLTPFSTEFSLGSLFAISASFLVVFVILSIKSLGKTHDSFSIVLFFLIFSSVVMFFPANISIDLFNSKFLALLICIGAITFIAQLFLTAGIKLTLASVGSTIGLSQIPMMYISGYLFFGQTLSIINGVGITFVLIGLFIMSIYQ